MAEAARAARGRFDRWAGSYERDPVSRWLAGLQDQALAALELEPGDRFLDIGCGTGAAVRSAAAVAERAAGVDLSSAMIERARALASNLLNVSFHRAESADLPFEKGEFTAVLCTTSFHHYPDPRAAVGEMHRVLGDGGRLVIGDAAGDRLAARMIDVLSRRFDPAHVRMYRIAELAGFLHDAGFERVAARRLLGGGYSIVRARKR